MKLNLNKPNIVKKVKAAAIGINAIAAMLLLLSGGFHLGVATGVRGQTPLNAKSKPGEPQFSAGGDVVRALTKDELERWTVLGQAEQIYNEQIGNIIKQAVSIGVEKEASMQVHSAIKDAAANFNLAIANRRTFIAQLRAEAACKDCIIIEGNLVHGGDKSPAGK